MKQIVKRTKTHLGQSCQVVDECVAAEMLGKAVQSLRNERFLRKGCPYIKLGRSVRYLQSDIQAYISKNRVDPEAD